jgi:phenylalanyl-tRNA synthetase beta chain
VIISLKWLSDFVDVKEFFDKPEILAEVLTKAGLEVENISNKAKEFHHVVVGHILEKEKHPNADKLSVCKVSTGEGVIHQIVCGAQNHKANDWVVVALPGAVLPGNFVIKNSVIRGVESGGMLCSVKELGLAKESEGILILPGDKAKYTNFAEYSGFNDVTFELKVTPNRADCLSHYGLAREIGCLLGKVVTFPGSNFASEPLSTRDRIRVAVEDAKACPRYTGRYVGGVKVTESPAWIRQRLESVGLNSINNVVDVTNYVMMELGQPMHAFDADQLAGAQLRIGRARTGQNFLALDGVERKLQAEDLIISDEQNVVALAGVMGGKNSGVSATTQNIFLESAYFDPAVVRKSQRSHGLTTDSAYRFTRGVDPDLCLKALERATELILNSCGGKAYSEPYDLYPEPLKKVDIEIKMSTLSERLGSQASQEVFLKILHGLQCHVETLGEAGFRVKPPNFRFDLETDMDLVEEYARIVGYDLISESLPPLRTEPLAHDAEFMRTLQLRKVVREQGYHQAVNLAFAGSKAQNEFCGNLENWKSAGLLEDTHPVQVINALSEEMNWMRQTLSLGLWQNTLHNYYQGNQQGRLFEIGKVFCKSGDEYLQSSHLGLLAWGEPQNLWQKQNPAPLVFSMKEDIENILRGLGVRTWEWLKPENVDSLFSFLHAGQQSLLKVQGKVIGFLGSLHPGLATEHKLRVPVAIAELNVQALLQSQGVVPRMKSISRQPVIERDLALLMNQGVPAESVRQEMAKKAGNLCLGVRIFDLYEDEASLPGQKSVAYRLRFQDPNATLQEEVVNKVMDELIPHLKTKFSLSVR